MAQVSIVIPTYHRGEVLLRTLEALAPQIKAGDEIVVVDQTPGHPEHVEASLSDLAEKGTIRWLRRDQPSITGSMNLGLVEANCDLVLFLDDDIIPSEGLVRRHAANYADESTWAVVGQILQPGQTPERSELPPYPGPGLLSDLDFPFNSVHRRQVYNCMAGNLSVRRDRAIAVGGMDEQFKGVAYRFETEFARRLTDAGGRVMFDPLAGLHHLQAPSGGTRTYGNHLTSASPAHGVGEYYMAIRSTTGRERRRYIRNRLRRSVATRFHLRHPWWIPVKLSGELRGLLWAYRLSRQGPKYLSVSASPD